MLALPYTCRWHPLAGRARARHLVDVSVRRNKPTSCSTSRRGIKVAGAAAQGRRTAAASDTTSTIAALLSPQILQSRRFISTAPGPSLATDVSWHVAHYRNGGNARQLPRRRHMSLWGGWGQGTSGGPNSSPEEELARRWRQEKEEEVLAILSGVVEPCTGKDVVELGFVQDVRIDEVVHGEQPQDNTGEDSAEAPLAISFTLRVPTLALPGRDTLASECEAALLALPWVASANALTKVRRPRWRRTVQRRSTPGSILNRSVGTETTPGGGGGGGGGGAPSPGLESVQDVVCVSSCKGGVGKSTVAVNLAYSLASRGAKVGLLDADVYGPSLPTLVNPDDVALRVSPAFPDLNLLSPIIHRGVACMSFGWVNAKAGVPGAGGHGAAVMRGPMVSKVINQLLLGTDWGELEYLIIDMPPGTGDIQITLGQALQMSGAVVVTTPQKLSYVDVVKGIDMFAEIKVPVLSVVENMAYFDCSNGERHRPFGPGHARELVEECGLASGCVFSLPLSPAVARGSDCGDPVSLSSPDGEEAKVYLSLADGVVRETFRAGKTAADVPEVSFKSGRGIVLRYISEAEAAEFVIPPFELRTRDPATGEPLASEQAAAVSDDVEPVNISVRGNYAVSISWSDGHRGAIYSYQVLRKIVEQRNR
ncbi:conserved unknown protein [Ectocarpus siliculosus]|uniref:Gamma-butyrobetaine hydroxylase-like N-terminal domain-containing protein n=1 Tax=Ectocarpus siliculosus TaxID=2880 RepID=D8LK11_ECTSI|nr:conserved unknown protein [Ectocarpus siliculosus]|eukprot:CBN74480.1 conserved unknown protein [Ectocarpus siliculosus]